MAPSPGVKTQLHLFPIALVQRLARPQADQLIKNKDDTYLEHTQVGMFNGQYSHLTPRQAQRKSKIDVMVYSFALFADLTMG